MYGLPYPETGLADANGLRNLRLLQARSARASRARLLTWVAVAVEMLIFLVGLAGEAMHIEYVVLAAYAATFIWLAIARLVIEIAVEHELNLASLLQDRYDANVFGIPYNPFISDEYEDIEQDAAAVCASRKCSPEGRFLEWYGPAYTSAKALAFINRQTASAQYDIYLRRYSKYLLIMIAVLPVSAGLILAGMKNYQFSNSMLVVVVPLLPVLVRVRELYLANLRTIRRKQAIVSQLNELKTNMGSVETGKIDLVLRLVLDQVTAARAQAIWAPQLVFLARNHTYQTFLGAQEQLNPTPGRMHA